MIGLLHQMSHMLVECGSFSMTHRVRCICNVLQRQTCHTTSMHHLIANIGTQQSACLCAVQLDGVDVEELHKKYPESDITAVKIRIGCDDDDEADCEEHSVKLPDGLVIPDLNLSSSDVTHISSDISPCDSDSDDDCEEVILTLLAAVFGSLQDNVHRHPYLLWGEIALCCSLTLGHVVP